MKWVPVIKAGKLNYIDPVIVHSQTKGAEKAVLEEKRSTIEGTKYVFSTIPAGEKLTDVTHFAAITVPGNK